MTTGDTRLPIELPAGYQQRGSFRRLMIFDAALDQQLVERIWESPAHVVSGGLLLQTKERCQVARIPFRDHELLFKHHNWGGIWKALGKVRVVPKARRAFLQAIALQQAGIRTPRPLALVESTFGRLGITSSLLTEYVPGIPLFQLIRGGQVTCRRVEALTDQIAVLCQRLAALRCAHNDLKPENLIVDEEDQIWLIDLENTRSYPDEEALGYWFNRDLDRLLRRRTWRFHPTGEALLRQKLTQVAEVARVWSRQRPLADLQAPASSLDHHTEAVLAAVILCERPFAELEQCVASVRDAADEVVLVVRQDAALPPSLADGADYRIVAAHGLSVGAAYAKAVEQIRAPWVLALRNQDLVSPDLALEIQILLESATSLQGFRVRCRRMLLNQVARFGVARGERPIRLFRRAAGTLTERNGQLTAEIAGPLGRLNSKIMVSEGETFRQCLLRVEGRAAAALTGSENPLEPRRGSVALQAGRAFLNDYFLKLGLLDGRIGLKSSVLRAWETYRQLEAAKRQSADRQEPASHSAERFIIPMTERRRPETTAPEGLFNNAQPTEPEAARENRRSAA